MNKMTLSSKTLALCLLTSGLQVVTAATITFVGRTDNATGTYNLTDLGDVDWAYWSSTSANPASGTASNNMDGGTSIGAISGTGGVTTVRGTTSTGGIQSDFSYTNGSGTASGTEFNPNGLFNTNLGAGGYGVELGFTLANAGQWYAVNVWTGGFGTERAIVDGSLPGATSFDSGVTSGTGDNNGDSVFADATNPKEQYLYTFNVIADNDNDVFNFRIRTSGTQISGSSHVLINAASISAIPEPSSLVFLLISIIPLIWLRRRKI